LVDAWEHTLRSIIGIGDSLTEEQWEQSTRCPGWSIKDIFSHVIGVERSLAGEPPPEHAPGEKPWVRNSAGAMLEIDVDLRRSRSGTEVLEELREVVDARHLALSAPELNSDAEIPFFGRTITLEQMLNLRIFDAWAHEQDIRAAINTPGGLDSQGAQISYAYAIRGLERALGKAELPTHAKISIVTTGPGARTNSFTIGEEGSVTVTDSTDASDATLTMTSENWVSLVCGREDRRLDEVEISGNQKLGEKALDHLVITF
jgi:uncharacterized protein (TIGR03083 family)